MKQYNIRHVSITYWTTIPVAQVLIYDEDSNGKSPVGHEGRCYEKVTNTSMLRLTSLLQRNNVEVHYVMGNTNVGIFFWMEKVAR